MVLGLLVFVCLLDVLSQKESFCPPHEETWSGQAYKYTGKDKKRPEKIGYVVAQKQREASNDHAKTGQERDSYIRTLLCDEVKGTDIALVYFTFCLVIVGWFTLRSADENTKRAERAYLVAGPFFGIPKEGVSKWMMENRASKHMFHGPWRMIVTNFGRTAAFSTKIEWGLCPEDKFPKSTPMKTVLESTGFERWRKDYMREADTIQNIFGEPNKPYQLRRIEIEDRDKYLGWIHFGRVTYIDVFKHTHYAAFAYLIGVEGSDAFGTYLSDEHD